MEEGAFRACPHLTCGASLGHLLGEGSLLKRVVGCAGLLKLVFFRMRIVKLWSRNRRQYVCCCFVVLGFWFVVSLFENMHFGGVLSSIFERSFCRKKREKEQWVCVVGGMKLFFGVTVMC